MYCCYHLSINRQRERAFPFGLQFSFNVHNITAGARIQLMTLNDNTSFTVKLYPGLTGHEQHQEVFLQFGQTMDQQKVN